MSMRILVILTLGVTLVLTASARADDPRLIVVLGQNVTMSGYDFLGDESGREMPVDRVLAAGRYSLEIIDVYQQESIAEKEQLIALPLLVKKTPLPERRMIGDLSNTEKVLKGLGILF